MRIVNKKIIFTGMFLLVTIVSNILMWQMFIIKEKNIDSKILNGMINSEMFAIMIEQSDGTYKKDSSSEFPINMIYNEKLSGCFDLKGNKLNGVLTYNISSFTIKSNITAYCNLYFDICSTDEMACDKSGNGYNLNIIGATWDKENGIISTDGVDDYMYVDNLDWGNTTEFTIDFVAKIAKQDVDKPIILFESSLDSNVNYGSFYVDTNEFGEDEITLAMKYRSDTVDIINHKMVNGIINNDEYTHYTITFDSMREYDNFTRMYINGVYNVPETTVPNNTQTSRNYAGNISGYTLTNYPFYIASRAGELFFSEINLKEVRVYNKALTDEEVILNYQGKIVTENLLLYYDFS